MRHWDGRMCRSERQNCFVVSRVRKISEKKTRSWSLDRETYVQIGQGLCAVRAFVVWLLSNLLRSEIACSNRRGPKQGRRISLEDGAVRESTAIPFDSNSKCEGRHDQSLLFSGKFDEQGINQDRSRSRYQKLKIHSDETHRPNDFDAMTVSTKRKHNHPLLLRNRRHKQQKKTFKRKCSWKQQSIRKEISKTMQELCQRKVHKSVV